MKSAEIQARSEKRSRYPQVQVDKKSLQSFGKRKVEKVRKSEQIQRIKQEQRDNALASFESKRLDAATILEKMDEMEDNEEEKELAELEARLFGKKLNHRIISLVIHT